MNIALYIARRYTISKSKSTAINIITGIAVLGIVASTAALFIIMSAFSGLRSYTVSFSNATDPDLKATARTGKSFTITAQQEQQLKNEKSIALYSKVAEERVLFYFDEKEQVAYLKGVDSLYNKVNAIEPKLVLGSWIQPATNQVCVGLGIADKLSLGLMDFNRPLEVFVPKPGRGAINTPEDAFNKSALTPVAVYSINDDQDSKYVFCNLDLAQELLMFSPEKVTGIEMRLAKGASETEAREALNRIFGNSLAIKNREQQNDSMYKMLNAENTVVYLFCSLVVVMTLFCLAGALIMLILDKKENIRTLHSIGAELKSLRQVFFLQGVFITSIGVAIGLLISSGVIFLQQQYSLLMITATLAYPVEFNLRNVVIVIATIYILGLIASRIAAGRVNAKLLEN